MRWKTVIHLNLVRSIRRIHEALNIYSNQHHRTNSYPTPSTSPTNGVGPAPAQTFFDFGHGIPSDAEDEASDLGMSATSRSQNSHSSSSSKRSRPKPSTQRHVLLMRLRPVLALEAQLVRILKAESTSGYGNENLQNLQSSWVEDLPSYQYSQFSQYPRLPLTPLSPSAPSPGPEMRPISPYNLTKEFSGPSTWGHHHQNQASAVLFPLGDIRDAGRDSPSAYGPDNSHSVRRNNPISSITPSRQLYTPTPIITSFGNNMIGVNGSRAITPYGPWETANTHSDGEQVATFNRSDRPAYPYYSDIRPSSANAKSPISPTGSVMAGHENAIPERILSACASDIVALWRDEEIRHLLCSSSSKGGMGLKLHEDAGL
jgi:hypothetical protein